MKKLFLGLLIIIALAFTGCNTLLAPTLGSMQDDNAAEEILWPRHYQLVPHTVYYYGSTFERADYFVAQAYRKGQLGHVMVNKSATPAVIDWSVTGDFYSVGP